MVMMKEGGLKTGIVLASGRFVRVQNWVIPRLVSYLQPKTSHNVTPTALIVQRSLFFVDLLGSATNDRKNDTSQYRDI